VCNQGGYFACKSLVDLCKIDNSNCGTANNPNDLNYYMTLPLTSTNIARQTVQNIAEQYYTGAIMGSTPGMYPNIKTEIENDCASTTLNAQTACNIIGDFCNTRHMCPSCKLLTNDCTNGSTAACLIQSMIGVSTSIGCSTSGSGSCTASNGGSGSGTNSYNATHGGTFVCSGSNVTFTDNTYGDYDTVTINGDYATINNGAYGARSTFVITGNNATVNDSAYGPYDTINITGNNATVNVSGYAAGDTINITGNNATVNILPSANSNTLNINATSGSVAINNDGGWSNSTLTLSLNGNTGGTITNTYGNIIIGGTNTGTITAINNYSGGSILGTIGSGSCTINGTGSCTF